MINLEKNNINLLIDFDSTIIQTETIEEIANISLKKNPDREHILKKITDLTNKAMNGEIDFPEALEKRLELLNSNRKHIKETTNLLKNKLVIICRRPTYNFNLISIIIFYMAIFIFNFKSCRKILYF